MNAVAFYSAINPGTKKILDAWSLALKAHDQHRYGAQPYSRHLEDVARCLEKFHFSAQAAANDPLIENIICAGWLHDVVEDAQISLSEIDARLGPDVADIVARVTDEQAPTRAERKALTYPKIRGHFGATVVKLADRIANVRACLSSNGDQFRKYVEEQNKFQEAVYVPSLAEPFWDYLRFLVNQKFGEKPQPLKSARFFYEKRPEVMIDITAMIEGKNLRIEDYAAGKRIESINDGDSDYERVLTVKSEFKDSILLALMEQRFRGNSALSEIQNWLSENAIPYEIWSG